MSLQSAHQFVCGFWNNRPLQVEQIEENLTSDTGLLAFAQLDAKLNWTKSFTDLVNDPRSDPDHSA